MLFTFKRKFTPRVTFPFVCAAPTVQGSVAYGWGVPYAHTFTLFSRLLLLLRFLPAKEKGDDESVGKSEWN